MIRVNTGLSAIVCGHLVELHRDIAARVATVQVKVREGYKVTGLEHGELQEVANDLAARAQRFLGMDWTVVPWHLPGGTAMSA